MNLARRTWLILIVSLAWAIALPLPALRGGFGWRWPYEIPREPSRLLPLGLALLVYIVGAQWFLRYRRAAGLLAWALAGVVASTIAALHFRGDPVFQLYAVTASGIAGGWHYAAAHIGDLVATLRGWPDFMKSSTWFSSHMGISPPGMVLAYYGIGKLFEWFPAMAAAAGQPLRALQCHNFRLLDYSNAQLASAWFGMLMPLWAGLTVIPLYWLGCRFFTERAARWSVAWWPLVPALLMFSPLPNTLYPLFALLVVGLLAEGLVRNRPALVLASGVLLSGLTFVTFTFVPLILLAGLFTLGHFFAGKGPSAAAWRSVSWPVGMGAWFGLGLVSVWLAAYWVWGTSFWEVFQTASQAHVDLERPYLPWLLLHTYDYLMFAGWPLAILGVLGAGRLIQKPRNRSDLREGDVLGLAVVLTFVILILSGTLRGETGRILLFFTPFLLLIASEEAGRYAVDGASLNLWVLTIAQTAMALLMIAFLRVISTEFDQPPPLAAPLLSAEASSPMISSGAVFGDALTLEGYAGEIRTVIDSDGRAQPTLALWLDWTSAGQVDRPYYLSLIPVAPDERSAAQATLLQPFDGSYPTTCWLPGRGPIRDRVEVPLFEAPSGDWWLSLSLIDADTGEGIPVGLPDGSSDRQLGIGPFSSD